MDTIEARVALVVGDDISTGEMAPDGAVGMAVWSNIPACSNYMSDASTQASPNGSPGGAVV